VKGGSGGVIIYVAVLNSKLEGGRCGELRRFVRRRPTAIELRSAVDLLKELGRPEAVDVCDCERRAWDGLGGGNLPAFCAWYPAG